MHARTKRIAPAAAISIGFFASLGGLIHALLLRDPQVVTGDGGPMLRFDGHILGEYASWLPINPILLAAACVALSSVAYALALFLAWSGRDHGTSKEGFGVLLPALPLVLGLALIMVGSGGIVLTLGLAFPNLDGTLADAYDMGASLIASGFAILALGFLPRIADAALRRIRGGSIAASA